MRQTTTEDLTMTNPASLFQSAHDVTRHRLYRPAATIAECATVRRSALKSADRVSDRWPALAEEWRRLAGFAARRNAEIRRAS